MEAKEIVSIYLRRSGLRVARGLENSLLPLAPYLLMDVALTVWNEEIQPIKVDAQSLTELSKAKERWNKAYRLFNRTFFACFTADQRDRVIEYMDSFSAYIGNQVTITKIRAMDIVRGEALEHQRYVSSLLVCNALSFYAETVWHTLYRSRAERINNQLSATTTNTRKMAEEYMRHVMKIGDRSYDENLEPLRDAMSALQRAILRWLNKEQETMQNKQS